MRTISIAQRCLLPVRGQPLSDNALLLADVDNDGQDELCVATTDGELLIFKADDSTLPVCIAAGLGSIAAIACGDVYGNGRRSLVAVSVDGLCCVFDVPLLGGGMRSESAASMSPHFDAAASAAQSTSSWTQYFCDENGDAVRVPAALLPTFRFRIPFNATAATIGGGGELVIATADRAVFVFRVRVASASAQNTTVTTVLNVHTDAAEDSAYVAAVASNAAALVSSVASAPTSAPGAAAAVRLTVDACAPSTTSVPRARNLSPLRPMSQASSMAAFGQAARLKTSALARSSVPAHAVSANALPSVATAPRPRHGSSATAPTSSHLSDTSDEEEDDMQHATSGAEHDSAFRAALPALAQLECIYHWAVDANWISAVHIAPPPPTTTLLSAASEGMTQDSTDDDSTFAVLFAATDAGWRVHFASGATGVHPNAVGVNSLNDVSDPRNLPSALLADFRLAVPASNELRACIVDLCANGQVKLLDAHSLTLLWAMNVRLAAAENVSSSVPPPPLVPSQSANVKSVTNDATVSTSRSPVIATVTHTDKTAGTVGASFTAAAAAQSTLHWTPEVVFQHPALHADNGSLTPTPPTMLTPPSLPPPPPPPLPPPPPPPPLSAPTAFGSLHRVPMPRALRHGAVSALECDESGDALVLVAWDGFTIIGAPCSPHWFQFRPETFGCVSAAVAAAVGGDTASGGGASGGALQAPTESGSAASGGGGGINGAAAAAAAAALARSPGNTTIVGSCAGRWGPHSVLVYATNTDSVLVCVLDSGAVDGIDTAVAAAAQAPTAREESQWAPTAETLKSFIQASAEATSSARHNKNLMRMTPPQVRALLGADLPLLHMYREWLRKEVDARSAVAE